jgi:RHS repeat-associated protein
MRTKLLGSRNGIGRLCWSVRYLTESLLGSRFDYRPFGPNEGWDWGNSGASLTSTPPLNQHLRQFDLDYRPTAIGNDPEGYSRNIAWDRANRITGITVPTAGAGSLIPGIANGQSLNQAFAYDTLDRLTQFNAGISGATTAATGLALLPAETFTYDGIGNRKSRTTQAPGTATTQATNYAHANASPANHWLTSSTGQLPNAYTYDASGNTLTESAARGTTNPLTGAINPTSTTSALTNTYDAKNRLTKTQIGATATDTVTYKINAMGQRVQKVGAGLYAPSTTVAIDATTGNSPLSRSIAFNARFTYDESGRLIGEYAPDGKLIAETIWFNDLPIATLRPKGSNAGTPLGIAGTTAGNPTNGATATNANNIGNNTIANKVNVEIFYIHPDHLGTPRVVTRSTIATGANAPSSATANSPGSINKATWRRESDPFGTLLGNSAPNENPQIITGTATQVQAATFIYDEMFPGQHRDRESGKFQNGYRDYDSKIGRYLTSDPIGLKAGLSTFSYVSNSPLQGIDPDGLIRIDSSCSANAAALLDAEKKIKAKLNECCGDCGSGKGGCMKCEDAKKILGLLDSMQVSCSQGNRVPSGSFDSGGNMIYGNRDACGFQAGIGFYITPIGFDKKKCGCLEATMLHESMHVIGYPGGDSNELYLSKIEKRCFKCAQ